LLAKMAEKMRLVTPSPGEIELNFMCTVNDSLQMLELIGW
jgi:hypothetical protein